MVSQSPAPERSLQAATEQCAFPCPIAIENDAVMDAVFVRNRTTSQPLNGLGASHHQNASSA
jgi:hypothetical protein